jgi:uncharacterized protein YbaR (Trm112 family)
MFSVNLAVFLRKSRSAKEFIAAQNQEVQRMAISQDLLKILACPACKAKVELKPDGSGLKCTECKRVYPVRDDIPVMLIDEAVVENEEPAGKA